MKELNILPKYEEDISQETKQALGCISALSSKNGVNAYLIGGIVRDIILSKKGFDIDVTLETNAIEFAKDLEKEYKNCTLKETHEEFKTAKVVFEIERKKVEIDLASTRKEIYKTPASLPTLKEHACPIKEDLQRRDFSINTLGMSLNKGTFGDIIDCLDGVEDINKKQLRILHKNSFVDDPTRILRMLKFSIRFGFEYEKETQIQMEKVLSSGQFDNLGTERIKLELKQTLNLNSVKAAERIISEDIYKLINTKIKPFINAQEIHKAIDNFNVKKENIWLVYLACLICKLEKSDLEKIANSLNLTNFEKKVLQDTNLLFENQRNLNSNYEIYKFFKGIKKEAIIAFSTKEPELSKKYLKKLQFVKIKTTGDALLNKGFKQGKQIGEILEKILEARLNNKVNEHQEEEILRFFS